MDLAALQQILGIVQGRRVACVGDLMVDRFVYGDVRRISPEAPIPVLAHRSEEVMLGACGNVARNVASLGGQAALAGVVGDDLAANTAMELIGAETAFEGHVVVQPGRPTSLKTRFLAGGQQLLRMDVEDREPVDEACQRMLSDAVEDAAASAGAILLSDYAKGVVTAATIAACHAAAQASGAPLVVDPKGLDFARYGPVDIIKPNAAELAVSTGLPTRSDEEVEAALAAALSRCDSRALLVTRAERGMSLMRRGEAVRHFRTTPREVFDVSGAGDTSLAALGLGLAGGAPLEAAIEFAILASGVAVGKVGTAAVEPAELLEAERVRAPMDAKVGNLDAIVNDVKRWRARGLRVGLTNGCFDVLHKDHIAHLSQAREWCDRLIVGLDGDEDRPVNDLASRAVVLAGLGLVDRILPLVGVTPRRLVEAIQPEVLIRGEAHRPDHVMGADLVAAYGGEFRSAGAPPAAL